MSKVIVALDVPTIEEAWLLAETIHPAWIKIGLELVHAQGIDRFIEWAHRKRIRIFLDLKLSDVPKTVERATRQVTSRWEPDLLSVRDAIGNAMHAVVGSTQIIHVPTLTTDVADGGIVVSSAHGVVCRPSMAPAYKEFCPHKIIICAGIRMADGSHDGHQDVAENCPAADYLVVGRPITRAFDPANTYQMFKRVAKGGDNAEAPKTNEAKKAKETEEEVA